MMTITIPAGIALIVVMFCLGAAVIYQHLLLTYERETVRQLRRCLFPAQLLMAQAECINEPMKDEDVILSYSGPGASDYISVGEVRDALKR